MENLLIPYQAVTEIPCSKAVVLAPHPDDEIFGCGGAILRHLARGNAVRVIVVSDGAYGLEGAARTAQTLARQQESRAAAAVLGCGAPEFWGMRDREVAYGEKLVRRILESLEDADLVYAPSVFEMHPDHRALGMAAVEAVRRCGKGVRLAMYEVGMPLRPNLLLDISDLMARKQAAMACFVSQNAIQRYDLDIAALNRYRTYTLPDNVTAAEAFILVNAEELVDDPFKIYQSEHDRQRVLGLHLDARDTPLVSVIIRSMDRPTLAEALDSVALQTYPNIEVVLVNAKGVGHRKMGEWCGRFPLRFIDRGQNLQRASAANVGLDAAGGEYLIFLDDDDWFAPEHITKLAETLLHFPDMQVCYTGVQSADADGKPGELVFESRYDADKLLLENYIPIHAVLFSANLARKNHCLFDESLDLYEDWDFWLQLSQHSSFATAPGVSAYYRGCGGESGSSVHDQTVREAYLPRIYDKWKAHWPAWGIWRAVRKNDEIIRTKYQPHIEHLDRVIHGLNTTIQENDRLIHDLNTTIQEKDRLIHDLNTAIQKQDRLIHEIGGHLEQERTRFNRYVQHQSANWMTQIAKAADLAVTLERERALTGALQSGVVARDAKVARLAIALTVATQKNQEMQYSRSWRLTAPLRAAARWLRGGLTPEALPLQPSFQPQPSPLPVEQPTVSLSEVVHCGEFRDYLACFRPCDELTDEVRWAMRAQIDAMRHRPLIAVYFSLLGLSDEVFQRLFDAVRYQLYPGWELWVIDGEFASQAQLEKVREAMTGDGRIHLLLESPAGSEKKITPPPNIEGAFIYRLSADNMPPELAFYRLAFFLVKYQSSPKEGETQEDTFTRWMAHYDDLAYTESCLLRSAEQALPDGPLISVLMPVYNTPEEWLRQAIGSLYHQFYRNWELCVVDDGSDQPHIRAVLEENRIRDDRIKVTYSTNLGVAGASNVALRMANGKFVVLMDHDDVIERLALFRVAESVVRDDPDMLYSDEAVVDENNRKVLGLVFRPAFSPEFLRAHPYIVHLAGFRREFLLDLGGFDETLRISHDYDLMLRAGERARRIVHIPEVLYRWRTHADSTGHNRMQQVTDASLSILARHLDRCGENAKVQASHFFNYYDIRYPLQAGIRVAIIIPTKNHGELVRQCVDSIVRTVREVAYDIVVINHDSDDAASLGYFRQLARQHAVLNYSGPFNFSAINNFAIRELQNSYTHYLFCNNDIEALESGWLERMVELGQQPGVGVVGAKLFYPDRSMIQHAGVVVGMNGIAGHAGQSMGRVGADGNPEKGYLGRLVATHEQMAVTAACMLVRRDAFDGVGGYDEDLAVGFGDTDLCLRIYQAGYRVLFCPHAELLHHESYTRGKSMHDPHPEDSALFRKKWASVLENGDPYYNPNLSITCSWWDIGENPLTGMKACRRIYLRDDSLPSGARIACAQSTIQ